MTCKYRTGGKLTNPVNDLPAAQAYLAEDMTQYVKYSDLEDPDVVFDIAWSLTGPETWVVEVITTRPLTEEESKQLSTWISGQNSDGLGEGFEQQPFAEIAPELDRYGDPVYEDADWDMASFDWQDNPCTLERVK